MLDSFVSEAPEVIYDIRIFDGESVDWVEKVERPPTFLEYETHPDWTRTFWTAENTIERDLRLLREEVEKHRRDIEELKRDIKIFVDDFVNQSAIMS